MKMQRLRIPVWQSGAQVDEVAAVVKIPRRFTLGQTPAVLLAHGAGGGVDDPALAFVQSYLVGRGFLTLGFNFPYREHGRKTPDRQELLESTVQSAIAFLGAHDALRPGMLFIGGKSMGGRMASHLAAAQHELAAGLVLLAYPLHAPGRPDRVRDKHLPDISVPTLFVSGTRDALAPLDSLRRAVKTVPQASLVTIEGADHSFNMLKRSGRSAEDVWHEMSETVANWLEAVVSSRSARPNLELASAHVPVVGADAARTVKH